MYSLYDFKVGQNEYVNSDGEYISKAEAQAEVDWLNAKYFPNEEQE